MSDTFEHQAETEFPAPVPAPAPAPVPAAAPALALEAAGVLVSLVTHPVVVAYDNGHLRVSPRTTTQKLLRRLLPTRLPAGVHFVPR